MTLFVFQWAIAFNSPVSVERLVGETTGFRQCNPWGGGGGGGGVRGFYEGSWPVVRTFDYCQVGGVGTFEFHPITDDILDWKLLKTWLPVS